jgi:hypothetical protein
MLNQKISEITIEIGGIKTICIHIAIDYTFLKTIYRPTVFPNNYNDAFLFIVTFDNPWVFDRYTAKQALKVNISTLNTLVWISPAVFELVYLIDWAFLLGQK